MGTSDRPEFITPVPSVLPRSKNILVVEDNDDTANLRRCVTPPETTLITFTDRDNLNRARKNGQREYRGKKLNLKWGSIPRLEPTDQLQPQSKAGWQTRKINFKSKLKRSLYPSSNHGSNPTNNSLSNYAWK
jgi:hypothetical protein